MSTKTTKFKSHGFVCRITWSTEGGLLVRALVAVPKDHPWIPYRYPRSITLGGVTTKHYFLVGYSEDRRDHTYEFGFYSKEDVETVSRRCKELAGMLAKVYKGREKPSLWSRLWRWI